MQIKKEHFQYQKGMFSDRNFRSDCCNHTLLSNIKAGL